jgi:hypothetical protein
MCAENGYELFYSSGGHGGPYWSTIEARAAAERLLLGCPAMQSVDIVERCATAPGGYGRAVEKVYPPRRRPLGPEPSILRIGEIE